MGRGLGNRFLDDLRHADALVHVVDVSGTTDEEGKGTRGYDPSKDIVWLRGEIVRWIQGNLMEKWWVPVIWLQAFTRGHAQFSVGALLNEDMLPSVSQHLISSSSLSRN
jgi:GTPase involved in cell partitioning and DNA repair